MTSCNCRRLLVVISALALLSGCEKLLSCESEQYSGLGSSAGATEQVSPAGEELIQSYLRSGTLEDLQYPDFRCDQEDVQRFYQLSGNGLPWTLAGEPTQQALAVIQVLKSAEQEGLNSLDYDGSRWDARLSAISSQHISESDLVRFDLALTISAMRYISDLHRGRMNPRQFHFDLDIDHTRFDLADFLQEKLVHAQDVNAAMAQVEPPFPAYRRTAEALKTYLNLERQDSGEPLPATKKPVKPGDTYDGVPRLTRLLGLLGDLGDAGQTSSSDFIYRGALVTAVKNFQRRHGLDANGIIDAHTLQELNTPLSARVMQLDLTLERWRWLPHEFERPPIVVNIPEFRVYVANTNYEPAFSMEVVVGKAYKHHTPVFATEMKSVIFRPYWNVPLDIQRNELLPEINKDPSYLGKNSYEVVDRNGNVVSEGSVTDEMKVDLRSGRLAIRQRPGPEDALGLLKFDMPNRYDVYMHGTPATQLFARSRRDFSHGCIRVEDPLKLAGWVLRDQPQWDDEHIIAAMNGDKTFRVNLTKSIPVLILYGTAVATEQGEVHFFDDIYKLDAELAPVIARGYPYTESK